MCWTPALAPQDEEIGKFAHRVRQKFNSTQLINELNPAMKAEQRALSFAQN
jgi:hypothetical protein